MAWLGNIGKHWFSNIEILRYKHSFKDDLKDDNDLSNFLIFIDQGWIGFLG